MRPLGLECLSGFGLHPAEFVRIAGALGCSHATLSIRPAANRVPAYPDYCFREDPALRREIAQALRDSGVAIGMMEGFRINPEIDVGEYERDLDHVAELGAPAICSVSREFDLARTHDQFARLTDMAARRGLITTMEVCGAALPRFADALAAVAAVAHPSFRLLIDTMHFFRRGGTLAELAALDPELIAHIQLCDVPMPALIADYMEEALYERRAPGDGDLPLAEFLRHVPEHVVIGLEIPIRSELEAGVGPKERMGRCVRQARTLFARIR